MKTQSYLKAFLVYPNRYFALTIRKKNCLHVILYVTPGVLENNLIGIQCLLQKISCIQQLTIEMGLV